MSEQKIGIRKWWVGREPKPDPLHHKIYYGPAFTEACNVPRTKVLEAAPLLEELKSVYKTLDVIFNAMPLNSNITNLAYAQKIRIEDLIKELEK